MPDPVQANSVLYFTLFMVVSPIVIVGASAARLVIERYLDKQDPKPEGATAARARYEFGLFTFIRDLAIANSAFFFAIRSGPTDFQTMVAQDLPPHAAEIILLICVLLCILPAFTAKERLDAGWRSFVDGIRSRDGSA